MKNVIEIDLYQSPVYEKNMRKYGERDLQCVCCGKPMKEGDNKMVHMNTNWKAMNNTIKDHIDAYIYGLESQGYFFIGEECAKKMPKSFIH